MTAGGMREEGGEKVEAGQGGRVAGRRTGAVQCQASQRQAAAGKGQAQSPQQPGPELQVHEKVTSKTTGPVRVAPGGQQLVCEDLPEHPMLFRAG